MGKIILPPNYPESKNPVIFLAGPIVGAEFWQQEAINIIKKIESGLKFEIDIASPSYEIDPKYLEENPFDLTNCRQEPGTNAEVD
jgi:hypothetical protein